MKTSVPDLILAESAAADVFVMAAGGCECDWSDIEAADGSKSRGFSMVAYSGGRMRPNGFPVDVVVDLRGIDFSKKSRPILRQHDQNRIVGHTTGFRIDGGLIVEGVISASNEHANEVIESSRQGFPWQASIGAKIIKRRFVPSGKTVEVNGRTFTGPLIVAEQSLIKEVSFVALGADDDTSAQIAASLASDGGMDMNFTKWLQAKGFDVDTLSDAQMNSLRAAYDTEQEIEQLRASAQTADDGETIAELRAELSTQIGEVRAELERATNERLIRAAAGGDSDLADEAIEAGWSVDKTELEAMRRSQAGASFGIHTGAGRNSLDELTLTAAACMSSGVSGDSLLEDRRFSEEAVNAADSLGSLGVRDLIAMACRAEGKAVPLTASDASGWMEAAFSTVSLPNIMANTMNKVMLAAYENYNPVALQVCKVGSVRDFKQVTRHRVLGTGAWERVGAGGELKHGTVGEQQFTNQADTHGQIFYLTRKDVINDDLGAFMQLPDMMGHGAAHLLEDQFFQLLNSGTLFSVGNGNITTGAGSAFDMDSLKAQYTKFKKQKAGPGNKAKDKRPINVRPTKLLVPVDLELEAEQLIGSNKFVGGEGQLERNVMHNKLGILSSPYLSDSTIGGSDTAWYMMADPNHLAAYEAVFLNGKRTPTIERVNGPEDRLVGMGFRGWFDFGFGEMDPIAMHKNAGV